MKTDIKAIAALWRVKRAAELQEEKRELREAEEKRRKAAEERKADERYISSSACSDCNHSGHYHRVRDRKCVRENCDCRGFAI